MLGDFVIQVRPDVEPGRAVFQGRVEHMDSGHSAHFQTADELIAFIIQRVQAISSGSNENLTAD